MDMIKKIITLLTLLISLSINAQTVYFGNLTKKISVGLGIDKDNVTLSLMKINKSKKFDSFNLRLFDMNGQVIDIEMVEDTIYHLELDKTYAHQKDYKISYRNYLKLKALLDSQSFVIINNNIYNGAAFVGILRSLEHEQTLFSNRQDVRKISIWSWNPGITMMRFKVPEGKGFRYIRK